MVDALSACVRAVLVCSLLQAAGAALYIALFGRALARSIVPVRRLGAVSAGIAAVSLVAFYLLEAARMAGDVSGMLDPELRALALASNLLPATARGVGLIALLASFASSRFQSLGTVGAVFVAASFATTGHSVELVPRLPAAILVFLHVLLGSAWFGALLPLMFAVKHESISVAGDVVRRFSTVAIWSVPPIAIAGLTLAAWLGVRPAHLGEPYSQLVVLKFAAFAVLMLLAAANKTRLGPRLVAGGAEAARTFRGSVAIEYVVLVGVLAATATLTTFFAPA